jgi:hypothetical protein
VKKKTKTKEVPTLFGVKLKRVGDSWKFPGVSFDMFELRLELDDDVNDVAEYSVWIENDDADPNNLNLPLAKAIKLAEKAIAIRAKTFSRMTRGGK